MINPKSIYNSIGQAFQSFQFHIGMINPQKRCSPYSLNSSFQFHIGMINP